MSILQKANVLPPKIYLKALVWGNGILLATWICSLLVIKEILSPLLVLILFIAIVICYFIGLYKHPQVNQAMKCNLWWWEYPLFVLGLIFAATRERTTVAILLWGFLYGNVVLLLKYGVARKVV